MEKERKRLDVGNLEVKEGLLQTKERSLHTRSRSIPPQLDTRAAQEYRKASSELWMEKVALEEKIKELERLRQISFSLYHELVKERIIESNDKNCLDYYQKLGEKKEKLESELADLREKACQVEMLKSS